MLYRNSLFLAVGVVLVGVFASPSVAAPTVKRLGVSNNSGIQSNIKASKITTPKATTTLKNSTTSGQRAPSVRVLGGTSVKPVIKATNNTAVSNTSAKTTSAVDAERLSVIRKNLIKGGVGTSASVAPQTQGVEADNMLKRIVALEEQILGKQEILEAGEGITIDDKTIAVSEEIVALPEKVNEIDQKISGLDNKVDVANLAENYYDKGYIQDNYYTKQYVDQIVSQLSGANVVDHFDPGFLHQ